MKTRLMLLLLIPIPILLICYHLKIQAEHHHKVQLTWEKSANCHGICTYLISRSDCNKIEDKLIGITKENSWVDEEVQKGHCYNYKVQACNDIACSAFSKIEVHIPYIPEFLFREPKPKPEPSPDIYENPVLGKT